MAAWARRLSRGIALAVLACAVGTAVAAVHGVAAAGAELGSAGDGWPQNSMRRLQLDAFTKMAAQAARRSAANSAGAGDGSGEASADSGADAAPPPAADSGAGAAKARFQSLSGRASDSSGSGVPGDGHELQVRVCAAGPRGGAPFPPPSRPVRAAPDSPCTAFRTPFAFATSQYSDPAKPPSWLYQPKVLAPGLPTTPPPPPMAMPEMQ